MIITKKQIQGIILSSLYECKMYAPFIREFLRDLQPNIRFYIQEEFDRYVVYSEWETYSRKWEIMKPFSVDLALGTSVEQLNEFVKMLPQGE